MNVMIIALVLFTAAMFVLFLIGRRCKHEWQNIHREMKDGRCIYIQQCKKCGKLRKEEFD